MAKEIERKFLVRDWKSIKPKLGTPWLIRQGYLVNTPEKTVRIRVANWGPWYTKATLTVKGKTTGITRDEYEFALDNFAEASEILERMCSPILRKHRYIWMQGDKKWEIDEFIDGNAPLVIAEIELADEEETLDLPEWIGEEVSLNSRYYNSNLVEYS